MKRLLQPNTTLYPVSVVLVTCGREPGNVLTTNRISSYNAEPPMLAISLRPERLSHLLIQEQREFAVNIPTPEMDLVVDYVGVVSGREEDKWEASGLTRSRAALIQAPLIAECPVNI